MAVCIERARTVEVVTMMCGRKVEPGSIADIRAVGACEVATGRGLRMLAHEGICPMCVRKLRKRVLPRV